MEKAEALIAAKISPSQHFVPQVSRERALQLERKKKAAQFLAQLAEKKTLVSSADPVGAPLVDEDTAVVRQDQEPPAGEGGERVETVNSWPPPQPPQLVIPTLAVPPPPPPKIRDPSPIQLSSGTAPP